MEIRLSDTFDYKKLMRFTFPSMVMMVVISVYSVVDGVFVSNLVGKNAFASLNLIYPLITALGAIGFMIATGGSALVAKSLGEGKKQEANEIFSMLIYVLMMLAIGCSAFGVFFIEPISIMLGATDELLMDCITYGRIMLIALPAFMVQVTFQNFTVVAGKHNMGLKLSLLAGMINIALDYLFMAVFNWGIAGAAAATGLSQCVGALIPFIYFLNKNNSSELKLVKFKFNGAALSKTCSNGISEMMTNLSFSVVNILYNYQLMDYIGPDGVSAYGVIMYVSFIFSGISIGYTIGVAPIISYHFGANNTNELKSLFKKSLVLVSGYALILTCIAEIFAAELAMIFVGYDLFLFKLTVMALRLYCISFLFSGINIFASAFFTALNNGKVSAFISFFRTLVLQAIAIMLLPLFLGVNGIWLSIVVAEVIAICISCILFKVNNKYYQYY